MNIKERLRTAYENVAYNADRTWVNDSFSYQAANLDLYVKERHLSAHKILELRPRTVKDCIPRSKLAQYANYDYNESRELSYSPDLTKYHCLYNSEQYSEDFITEPWMLREIDDIFMWFLHYQNYFPDELSKRGPFDQHLEHASTNTVLDYESPILRANSFEENILKMLVTSDRIKHIWNVNVPVFHGCTPITKDKRLNIYKSPSGLFFLSKEPDMGNKFEEHYEWFRDISEQNMDFEHLKQLSKSFKEQTAWILKYSTKSHHYKQVLGNVECSASANSESVPIKRLYSAVLQGSLPTKLNPQKINDEMTVLTRQIDKVDQSTLTGTPTEPNSSTAAFLSNVSKLGKYDLINQSLINQTSRNFRIEESTNAAQASVQYNMRINPKVKSNDIITPNSSVPSSIITNSNFVSPSIATTSSMNSSFSPTFLYPNYFNNYSNYQCAAHCGHTFQSNCLYSNSFSSSVSHMVTSRNLPSLPRQNFVPNTYQLPSSVLMLQHNRSSTVYPVSSHYIQQTSNFYTPISLPRTVHNVSTKYGLPHRPFSTRLPIVPSAATNWIPQNQHPLQNTSQQFHDNQNKNKIKSKKVPSPQMTILSSKGKLKLQEVCTESVETEKSSIKRSISRQSESSCSAVEVLIPPRENLVQQTTSKHYKSVIDDFEEVVTKTVGVVFENTKGDNCLPVTVTLSDDLEVQALQQYNNSNENFYQELERQAKEQYEDCSENWIGPPNHNIIFGGFVVQ